MKKIRVKCPICGIVSDITVVEKLNRLTKQLIKQAKIHEKAKKIEGSNKV